MSQFLEKIIECETLNDHGRCLAAIYNELRINSEETDELLLAQAVHLTKLGDSDRANRVIRRCLQMFPQSALVAPSLEILEQLKIHQIQPDWAMLIEHRNLYGMNFTGTNKIKSILWELEFMTCRIDAGLTYQHIQDGRYRFNEKEFRIMETIVAGVKVESQEYQFAEEVAFKISHLLPRFVLCGDPIVWLIRDPRDCVISRLDTYKPLFENDNNGRSAFTISDALHLPLEYGAGGNLGLGYLEEWSIIYKLLIPLCDRSVYPVRFESLKSQNEADAIIFALLEFWSLSRESDQIQAAIRNSSADLRIRPGAGRSFKWKSRNYTELEKQYSHIARTLDIQEYPLTYAEDPVPQASRWPAVILKTAVKHYVSDCLRHMNLVLPNLCDDHARDFGNTIGKLAWSLVEEIPLIELTLCRALIRRDCHTEFCSAVLENHVHNPNRILRLMACSLLADQPCYQKSIEDILFDTDVGKRERGFIVNALHDFGWTICLDDRA